MECGRYQLGTGPEQVKFVSLSAPQQAERKRVVIEGDSPQAISELADHLRKAMN
ncbi:Uncharacterised protein [Budvicia aquatica]|uniref:Electron transfer flavoprotein small subunit n=1 Tax=Budvicia aquatica TaxID=82979 RepID=A0A484ZEM8_9GAMM|nr:Uncharacterised protein [Budvicia aquatica]